MKINRTRWRSPILGQEVETVYTKIYGSEGANFLHVLETSPYEIAVVSRLVAYLQKLKEGEK